MRHGHTHSYTYTIIIFFEKSKIIAVAFPQAIAMIRQGDSVYWEIQLGWERQKSVALMASSIQTCAPFSAHLEKKMRHTEVGRA